MAYCNVNFKTKKALKEAVKSGQDLEVWQAGPFSECTVQNGIEFLEGPWYPEPHSWYAQATMSNGKIVKVK